MVFILYISMVISLVILSSFVQQKEIPVHAVYTRFIYPAISVFVSLFFKSKRTIDSIDFIVMYGNKGRKEQIIIEKTTRLASLIMFLIIPVAVYTFSIPGEFELFICFALSGLGYFLPNLDLRQKAMYQRESILRDFSVFCMDLAVLTKAGVGLERAWSKALKNREVSVFYKEARLMTIRTEAGISLEQSIISFARRLGVPEVYSFSSVVSQSVKTGAAGTSDIIKEFAVQSWQNRCQKARENGEKASVKMVFPLAMGLTGIIVVVAFPAFAAMKGLI